MRKREIHFIKDQFVIQFYISFNIKLKVSVCNIYTSKEEKKNRKKMNKVIGIIDATFENNGEFLVK